MRVLYSNHSCVLRVNQDRLLALARRPRIEVGLLAPPRWRDVDTGNRHTFQRPDDKVFTVFVREAFMTWHQALFVYRWRAVAGVLDTFRPDLVHIEQEPYSVVARQIARAARLYGAKIVLSTWENLDKRYPLPFGLMERSTLRAVDRLVAGTPEIQRLWERRAGRSGIPVVPLGYEPKRFYPRDGSALRNSLNLQGFVIGYMGRLTETKGLRTLLEAAAKLPPSFTLLFDGRGPYREEMERRASTLGLASKLVFVDPSHEEVPEYISCMDVLVVPAYSTPKAKVQFSRVLVEAMACGVPVVGSSSGAIPGIIGEAGLIFPERDAAALARCLERIMREPGLRAELRWRGLERAPAHFSWDRVAEQMHEVYDECLRRESCAP